MRAIAGAILVLAGVIPLCFGIMFQNNVSFGPGKSATALQIGGALGVLVGVAVLIWGFKTDVALHDLRKRLDALENSIAKRSSSAEEIVDQLRSEGMIRPGASIDKDAIEDILEQ